MIKIFSPAKINLTLDVFAKKPGARFHEIQTIYHKVNWGDTLIIEKNEAFELIGDFDCAPQDNLIYKAWQLLKNTDNRDRSPEFKVLLETGLGKIPPVKVTVQKIIPSGAGLGGGSSNVAAFVQGYFRIFNLGSPPKTLESALAELGKDIPFFLQSAPCALGTHYGENITPMPFNFSHTPIYIFNPDHKQSTDAAYQKLDQFNTNYTARFLESPGLNLCNTAFNCLFDQKIYTKNNAMVLNVSGSGSSFFSFEDLEIHKVHRIKTKLA